MGKKINHIKYQRPPLADYQIAFLDNPERFTIVEASTKAGKTASMIIWLFEQALIGNGKGDGKGMNFWWVAPVFSQSEIAFKRFQNDLNIRGFFTVNKTKLTLGLPNGSTIHFKSADNADSLYGEDCYAIIADEYTRMQFDAFTALRSTLTATRGKMKLIGNVKSSCVWGKNLRDKARTGVEGYAYFKITAYDAVEAGILDLEEVEQAKRDLPDLVFRELYLAEEVDNNSNPFGLTAINECVNNNLVNDLSKAVVLGIDLAKSVDYTVIIGLDSDMNVCFFDRFQGSWKSQIAKFKELPLVPTLVDSTGSGDPTLEWMEQEVANGNSEHLEGFKFTSASKQQLMEGLAVSIQNHDIQIPENEIAGELRTFEYEFTLRGGVRYNAPSGLHDDCVCALALAVKHHKDKFNMDFTAGYGFKLKSSTNTVTVKPSIGKSMYSYM